MTTTTAAAAAAAAASSPGWLQWALILVPTALLLSLAVAAQTAIVYWLAYVAAPYEVAAFIDTVEFSIQENESYDRDVVKVQRLEDKMRLGRLLREIQRSGDDLREELSALFVVAAGAGVGVGLGAAEKSTMTARPGAGSGERMRTSARLLWAAKRTRFEDRVRRLDLLRMRFLVVYLGIITSIADKQPPPAPPLPPSDPNRMPGCAKATATATATAATTTVRCKPALRRSLNGTGAEPAVVKYPPVRRLTTQAIGHQNNMARAGQQGWAGVVEELQLSPRMHQRHASIERSISNAS